MHDFSFEVNEVCFKADQLAHTAQSIQQYAVEEWRAFMARVQVMVGLQTQLDLLQRRYHLRASYLTTLAQWYVDQWWYEKLMLACTWVVGWTLFGLLLNQAVIFFCLSLVTYYLLSALFTEHVTGSVAQLRGLCHDLFDVQTQLTLSMQRLDEGVEKIKALLMSSCEQNRQSAEHLKVCETQVLAMNAQVLQFKQQIRAFEERTTQILTTHAMVAAQLEATQQERDRIQALMNECVTHLEETIVGQQRVLVEKTEEMTQMRHQFQERLETFTQLEETLSRSLSLYGMRS